MFSVSTKKVFCLCLLGLCLAGFVSPARAQLPGQSSTDSILTAKNFPLLALLQQDKAAVRLIGRSKVLQRQAATHRQRLLQAGQQCQTTACYATALKWTEAEIAAAAAELVRLEKRRALGKVVTQLRRQGSYARFEAEADTALLRQAWVEAA
ncbi:MAG: hypothetical protein ACO1NZ_15880, partial [Adhaeribacter sp.]